MRLTLPILIATFVRSDQEEAIDTFEFLMSVREGAWRIETEINATGVTIDLI